MDQLTLRTVHNVNISVFNTTEPREVVDKMVVKNKNSEWFFICSRVKHLKILTINKLIAQRGVWRLLLIGSVFYFVLFIQSTDEFNQEVIYLIYLIQLR